MDPLFILLAVVALGLIAHLGGDDSRDRIRSHEERLAGLGMAWPDSAADGAVWPGVRDYPYGKASR
jgi:hypothetical protein